MGGLGTASIRTSGSVKTSAATYQSALATCLPCHNDNPVQKHHLAILACILSMSKSPRPSSCQVSHLLVYQPRIRSRQLFSVDEPWPTHQPAGPYVSFAGLQEAVMRRLGDYPPSILYGTYQPLARPRPAGLVTSPRHERLLQHGKLTPMRNGHLLWHPDSTGSCSDRLQCQADDLEMRASTERMSQQAGW